jgi:DivIVA domain-containing protein
MWPGGNYPEQFVARLEQRAVLGSRDMYLFAATTLSVMWRKPNRTEGGNELINFVRRTDRYFCEGLWRAPPGQQFTTTRRLRPGYDPEQVDAFLDEAEPRLAAIRRIDPVRGTILTDGPSGPSGPTQRDFRPPRWTEWAEWAESTRFSTTPRRGWGYTTAEVDAFRQEIRDTFLGVRQPLLTSDEARDKRFTLTRQGYKLEEVDAFFDQAEQRLAAMRAEQWLAAMRPTDKGRRD